MAVQYTNIISLLNKKSPNNSHPFLAISKNKKKWVNHVEIASTYTCVADIFLFHISLQKKPPRIKWEKWQKIISGLTRNFIRPQSGTHSQMKINAECPAFVWGYSGILIIFQELDIQIAHISVAGGAAEPFFVLLNMLV